MSDLIKRSDVLNILEENGWLDDSCLDELINQIPTAYDIDKVVEELEKELQFYENRMSEMGGTDRDIEDWGAIKRLNDAIEIVKAGGKSEWGCFK